MGITIEEVIKKISILNNDVIKYFLVCINASEKDKAEVATMISNLVIKLSSITKRR